MLYGGKFLSEEFCYSLQRTKPVKTLIRLFNHIGHQCYFDLNLICPVDLFLQ